MIGYMKKLHRFYNTKDKKIVSSKAAFDWALAHDMHHVPVIKTKHVKHNKKHTKRVAKKSNRPKSYNRPSYKQLYKKAIKQLKLMEHQYSADKFHPFIANQTKDGYVSPATNIKDVKQWMKHHTGKLFVVAALGTDDHVIVKACGSVDDLTATGFATRDLVPELISIFEDGYND